MWTRALKSTSARIQEHVHAKTVPVHLREQWSQLILTEDGTSAFERTRDEICFHFDIMVFSVFYSCPDNDKISYHPNQEITVRSSSRRVREREKEKEKDKRIRGRQSKDWENETIWSRPMWLVTRVMAKEIQRPKSWFPLAHKHGQ